jgi:hypothetical protein
VRKVIRIIYIFNDAREKKKHYSFAILSRLPQAVGHENSSDNEKQQKSIYEINRIFTQELASFYRRKVCKICTCFFFCQRTLRINHINKKINCLFSRFLFLYRLSILVFYFLIVLQNKTKSHFQWIIFLSVINIIENKNRMLFIEIGDKVTIHLNIFRYFLNITTHYLI